MHTKLNPKATTNVQTPNKMWRLSALAAAMGAFLSVVHVDANALALGRISAMSALGEPLVASIEVPDINEEERASLKAALASPDAFKVAGMEYNPALASTQVTLMRRDNGSNYLLLKSDKVVTDPFVSLVVNASWSNGRIVRNYTLLLDPPAAKQSEAAAVTAPVAVLTTPAPARAPVAASVSVSAPAATTVIATPSQTTAPSPAPAAMPKAPAASKASTVATAAGEQVKVNAGDTAGRIAANNLPANVSLEQMLAAMLRGNPQAFIGNNVNRLKAGTILEMPTEAQASAISTKEARQNLIAQSKDFSSFRRKLAESAPARVSKSADRVASGKIEAKVEDQKTAAVAPDKLTLSKGGLSANDKSAAAAKENVEKVAKERQAKDDAARSAELAKNIKDLNKIASATPAAQTSAAAVTASAAPAVAVAAAPASVAPATPAPTAVAKAPIVAPVVAPSAPAESSFIDDLMRSDLVKPLAGGLLAALLGGAVFLNHKRKKRKMQEDAEDDLLHEVDDEKSFFNDTSNEPVMAQDIPVVATEFHNAPTAAAVAIAKKNAVPAMIDIPAPRVNASKTVDPLTEANVYLDYGRDEQAEEILKDGLKTQPGNAAIYSKLLDIYAKRRDAKNFEYMAMRARPLLTESGSEWLAISRQGFDLEPGNPLYKAGATQIEDPFNANATAEFSPPTVARLDPVTANSSTSVDLDLDFDFASSFPTSIPAKKMEPNKTPLVEFADFSLPPANTSASTPTLASAPTLAAQPQVNISNSTAKPIEFGLDHLSLDLNGSAASKDKAMAKVETTTDNPNSAPLETKLALAQEFRSIGDTTGAKMLANEVLTLATGSLKARAAALLSEMS
jgi:pilus assembly protein FimV